MNETVQKLAEKAGYRDTAQGRADPEVLMVLVGGLLLLVVAILLARVLLRRSKRLCSMDCPACDRPMHKVKTSGWVRLAAQILPFWTLYCSSCRHKYTRVKPSGLLHITRG